ncbi:YjgF-like protein [Gloeophyllum trabeum ATCC 11539]|uniref:YjgF-like protein n=1 Tax=Gloeophyllum trabeum (strain ATCC 11539 / FP-39264 / Madison 617) TaxID=670483 RepID=S7RYM3_GLOTA|nr:YjgF-like protein [Gloeophyllum trabeum ATCC 11539]EPQ60030.1 YjgF-like protein [Gloeophyllum trabeum ATCC 11539]
MPSRLSIVKLRPRILLSPFPALSRNLRSTSAGLHIQPSSPATPAIRRSMSSSTGTRTHPSLSIVSTQNAPAAIGPYSQGITLGDLVFVSGCVPFDPQSGAVVPGGIEPQTRQALANLRAVVEASGSEVGKIVKTTVFLKSMDDFATVNAIYADFFGAHKPARSCVEVARLPKDVLFEIECIARSRLCQGVPKMVTARNHSARASIGISSGSSCLLYFTTIVKKWLRYVQAQSGGWEGKAAKRENTAS